MKYGWVVLALLIVGLAPREASSQVSVYGQFSVADLSNLVQTDYLYGATTGFLMDGPKLGKHFLLVGDLQGRFEHKSNERMDGITVGPRIEAPLKKYTPYAEFMVGFARFQSTYNTPAGSTTDSTIQMNGGVARQLTPRWDASVDFSYAQYYAYGGEYNPKVFSVGAVYHFVKR